MSYDINVQNLKEISASEVDTLPAGSYVYFGRGTCPYCVEFSSQFPDAGIEIFYVNTSNMADPVLQEVRQKYNAPTVPTFIYKKSDGTFAKLNRDVRQTIADFVAQQ